MEINVRDYGAAGDGTTLDTTALQKALDAGKEHQAMVRIPAGRYLTGSIFLSSGARLCIDEGAVLLGSENIEDYPQIESRIAGIEMTWPAAILNVIGAENVTISGAGTIDGQGEVWWDLYWGPDEKGGRRKEFDAKNLRWIADYEIQRPRLLLVQDSKKVTLADFTARRSGFWTVQLTYAEEVRVERLTIQDNRGPSTDGIDVDSCRDVWISDCDISCNDDDIVIKSGRDADGLRVNRVCEKVTVTNCRIHKGAGITIGSEVSGGIRDVVISDNSFTDTDCGFRMKSSRLRGGFIENIRLENLKMHNVQFPFSWNLDWHPAYNTFILPEGEIPEYWHRVAAPVPEEKQHTAVRNIQVTGVTGYYDKTYEKPSRAFDLKGSSQKPMTNISFQNITLDTKEYGVIAGVADITFQDVRIAAPMDCDKSNDLYDQR